MIYALSSIIALAVGFSLAYVLLRRIFEKRFKEVEEEARRKIEEAERRGEELKRKLEREAREKREDLLRLERRLIQREEALEKRIEGVERREASLLRREREVEERLKKAKEIEEEKLKELEKISGLTRDEAKEELFSRIEEEHKEELIKRLKEEEERIKREASERAKEIIASAIQRYASEVAYEGTVSVIPLPSDDMKGRLIGREGRNIRAIEALTGVDLIIDDTPEVVAVSCFDPIRREIAKRAIEKLILDGRIHPGRIEEMVEKARMEVEGGFQEEGEKAAMEVGVPGLHPEILKLLGKLKYRTSYGQNLLHHSIEVAKLSALLAGEIGADVDVAKKAGLLHDIGKALDDVPGPHALIGADLVKRLMRAEKISRAIAEHHGEVDMTTVEGFIVSAADAISSSRPGARRESLEQYIKRIESLEKIANSFPGVEKSFAIQAGREIRVLVKPHEVDDLGALRLANSIAKKIEETLEYPGQVKVTVIRETRVTEYAR